MKYIAILALLVLAGCSSAPIQRGDRVNFENECRAAVAASGQVPSSVVYCSERS